MRPGRRQLGAPGSISPLGSAFNSWLRSERPGPRATCQPWSESSSSFPPPFRHAVHPGPGQPWACARTVCSAGTVSPRVSVSVLPTLPSANGGPSAPLPRSAGLAGSGVGAGARGLACPCRRLPGGGRARQLGQHPGVCAACPLSCFSRVRLSESLSMRFPNNIRVRCRFLLQEIFPTQGSNLRLSCPLHCRRVPYLLSCLGSPRTWQVPPNPPAILQVPAKTAGTAGGPQRPPQRPRAG